MPSDEEKQASLDRLDAELIEMAVLSGLPENQGKARGLRITTGDGCSVIALFLNGKCLGVVLDERNKKP